MNNAITLNLLVVRHFTGGGYSADRLGTLFSLTVVPS